MTATENRSEIASWLLITFGTLLSATGYAVFILPLNLFEGGVTGIGIVIAKFLGEMFYEGRMLPIVGLISWFLTLILFAIAVKLLGRSFGARSIYATTLLYFSMDLILWLMQKSGYAAKIVDLLGRELLVAAIYGAMMIGAGMAIVFNQGAATGGADALAQMVRKLKQIPVGKTILAMDVVVLSIGFFTFADVMTGFRTMMYSFIFVFIQAKVLDTILNGFSANNLVTIITENPEEIKQAVFAELARGMTVYQGQGGYTGVAKITLSTVVSKKQIPVLRRLVAQTDPDSFVIVQPTEQVYGNGFEKLPGV